jgi:ABC-type nitrate/sulfonate/bicarbonate transport system substrate-binding protein
MQDLRSAGVVGCLLGSLIVASAACAEPVVIRVGWTMPGEDSKYWLMHRPQLFPELGKEYKIEWSQFQGTAPMAQAMLAGALDCSTQGVLSLAQATIRGKLESYIVAQHLGENPKSFSVYWAVKDDSPIKTVADLKGKTVGTNVLGGGLYGQFAMVLQAHGVDPKRDIRMVETGFPGSEAAIRAGQIDAGVMNQPFAARAEEKGGLRKLFSISEALPTSVQIVEACRKEFVDKHPEAARRYVRDLTLAMNKALADRNESIKITSEVTKLPVPLLETFMMTENDQAREPGAKPDFKGVQDMLDIYAKTGMVSERLDASKFKHSTIVAPIE